MYLVAWLPPGWNDRSLAARLDAAGVTAAPLSALTLATRRRPALVLGYTGHSEAAMARAVERMAEVLQPQAGLINTRKAELRSDQTAR
jgi:DNA-binding transcriptional MocR family regulator